MENLKLNNKNLSAISERVATPKYDRATIKTGIVHVGIGGFHRAHEALYTDELLQDESVKDWGICGVALLDFDTKIYNTLKEQDGLYTLIVKELDGTHTKRVIGSITECLFAPENPTKVIDKMASPEVKIITLTITEGGYNYNEATKKFDFTNPLIIHDLENPNTPKTIFGYITQALKLRQERGLKGITIQSCDNIQGNGHMTQNMLLTYVAKAAPGLVDWIHENVSFPNAMVDRITPVTAAEDITHLKTTSGIDDAWPVVCEPFKQWVIEDNFIAGRPAWETVGAQFVEDVVPYEKMKLSLLNAGHSVLGLLGALMGYNTIDQAVNNPNIRTFLTHYMDVEVTPTLGELEGINLNDYKQSLLERFGNINIKDQIDRICSETSAKFPIFILPTVYSQLKNNGSIQLAAFVTAAWAIYSLGTNENGETLNIKDALKVQLNEKAIEAKQNPTAFLEIDTVFGKLQQNKQFSEAYVNAYKNITNNNIEANLIVINNTLKNTY
ncbi:mannitol dehydrogenase family protein [Lacinutrix sp. C3R15]|uniref:mannitol dehydrogenase family protein n=1 Tax=Flavobacteriaceae TaxID=49546 RepID=UPI001C0971C7|nr:MULTISPECIES: mannitol dehydrogenase family protein [Flavobacteriaceae]MBU2938551.1 mannitol dehydrogenase family protein [Lacinutrix sp. C3R15]MDO6621865.1 mannitol dehydrogenase family protein [Oceanihabitans sp. 1_MG-2023]